MTTATITYVKHSKRTLRTPCEGCGAMNLYKGHIVADDAVNENWCDDCGMRVGDDVLLNYDETLHECSGVHVITNAQPPRETVPAITQATTTATAPTPAMDANKAQAAMQALQDIFGAPKAIDHAEVERIAREVINGVVYPTRTVVIKDNVTRQIDEATHKQFGDVLTVLSSGENLQLVGGPGVGKTHLVAQAAKALDLPFYVINFHLQSTASELRGYNDATGNFVPTVVSDWANNPDGGVLLLDELDRSHAGIQAGLNSLLGNRYITLPNRETVHLTDKHIAVAATNTDGTGPTRDYPAAQPFSAEFRDRFVAMTIEIDESIEMAAAMAKGANEADTKRVVEYVRKIRKAVKQKAIVGVLVTPRASQKMAGLLAHGATFDQAASWVLRKGMDDETWARLTA
ncbi:gas vesicle protein GvpN [Mycobacteroides abscessus subsp. bolletii]|uniref:AAA family ATPase n=1 Tax=Mycobacteroides abscessus TaxID=36809 RepID=UPI0009A867A8|nr:AAA family ATPase [Mycobacteroides abscessus]SKG76397.1 gas vesicle protein GvpN [Mycobacteroides abscessus subsp. bolletii]SKH08462.1 gas vesicle protein GvpN [Mycobacteroides abscessus subsp. bolletii]